MTAPITAGRTGGVSFRLFGIPVTIHVTFVLVIALLGIGVGNVQRQVVWVAVATAAVLLHELGHAVVGRMAGLTPRIDLAGLGGLTSWGPTDGRVRADRRGWSLAISLAGPGIGFLGGGLALLLGAPCCRITPDMTLVEFAALVWLFACFVWGVLNMLPVLPLDGGQALRDLLPGDLVTRTRRAAIVGVVFGGTLVGWGLLEGRNLLALLAAWLTWTNIQQARNLRGYGRDPGSPHPH